MLSFFTGLNDPAGLDLVSYILWACYLGFTEPDLPYEKL